MSSNSERRRSDRRTNRGARPVTARVATFKERRQGPFYVVIDMHDVTNCSRRIIIARDRANRRVTLESELYNAGLPAASQAEFDQIASIVRGAEYDENLELTRRTGWHGSRFLRPDGRMIGKGAEIILQSEFALAGEDVAAGDLKAWRENVATPMGYSSTGTFALCLAFAAVLLPKFNETSGIIHIFGKAATGKTTVARGAQSVHMRADPKAMEHWDATPKAFEERAVRYNCALMPLDEIAMLGANDDEISSRTAKAGFTLAAGGGRERSVLFDKGGRATWSVLALSTGEQAVSEYFANRGVARLKGDMRRVIDVPIKATPELGIFDLASDELSPSSIASLIEQNASVHYGVAIEGFISSFLADEGKYTKLVDRWKSAFLEVVLPSADAWERTVASRFALAYAAGRLASKFEILPFAKAAILAAVRDTYLAARETTPVSRPEFGTELSKIFTALCNSEKFMWVDDASRHTEKELSEVECFLRGTRDGRLIYAVRPAALREWISPGVNVGDFGRYLQDLDLLVTDTRNVATKQLPIPGFASKDRFYWFSQDALDAIDWLRLVRRGGRER